MEHGPYDLEKQQRMLLRTLADLQQHIQYALSTRLVPDFEPVSTAYGHLKAFVEGHVTAPEIRIYMSQIKYDVHLRGLTPTFNFFGMRFGAKQTTRVYEADRRLLRDTEDLLAKIGNLEILVRMMGDD